MGRSDAKNSYPKNSGRGRGRYVLSQACLRSAITNGSALLEGLDHRSAWARRLRDLCASFTSDAGGDDAVSEAERALIRRAAMLTLQAELLESRWGKSGGEAPEKSLLAYQRVTGALRRVLQTLGLQRRQRDITPDPLEYARQYDAGNAEAAE